MSETTRPRRLTRLGVVALLLAGVALLQHSHAQEKSTLSRHYVLDKIRVFYTLEGAHKLDLETHARDLRGPYACHTRAALDQGAMGWCSR